MSRFSHYILCFVLVLFGLNNHAQTYILNEDFSSASGTTPPSGWTNNTVTGTSTDLWHFDNPGSRSIGFPFIGNYAIFDCENYSYSNGSESSVLESPYIDCSISPNIFLIFDYYFAGGTNAVGNVEVFDGSSWNNVSSFSSISNSIENIKIDISSFA